MCVVSNVFNDYIRDWQPRIPTQPLAPAQPIAPIDWSKALGQEPKEPPVTDEEIREFRRLLEAARKIDRETNAPPCEDAKKKEALKEIAKALGINIDFIDEDK